MKNLSEFNIKSIMRQAETDPQYQALLEYYREKERSYRQLSDGLSREDADIIEQYLAAGEAVYYQFSRIAYQCGKRSCKK